MSAPIPATVLTEIEEQLTRLLFDLPGYLPAEDERIVAWRDELEKLVWAGRRIEAFIGLALVSHVTGDVVASERLLTRAETAGANEVLIAGARSAIYINLGFASKALSDCSVIYSAAAMNIGVGLPRVISCGGFALAKKLLNDAHLAKIDLSHVDQIKQIMHIAEGASSIQVSDDQYARVLDIAGEILRKHRVFWLESSPRFSFDPEMHCAGVRYRVEMTPEDASKLTDEFIDRLIDEDLAHIPLTIRFIGTKVAQEKAAEVVEG